MRKTILFLGLVLSLVVVTNVQKEKILITDLFDENKNLESDKEELENRIFLLEIEKQVLEAKLKECKEKNIGQ